MIVFFHFHCSCGLLQSCNFSDIIQLKNLYRFAYFPAFFIHRFIIFHLSFYISLSLHLYTSILLTFFRSFFLSFFSDISLFFFFLKATKRSKAIERKKELNLTVQRLRTSQTRIIELYGRARERYVYPVRTSASAPVPLNYSTKTVRLQYNL